MSKKKPIVDNGIIIYYDYDFIFNFLTDEEVGKTIRLLLKDKDNPTLNPTDNDRVNNAYNYIASRIIEYKKSRGLAVEWGKKGGNPQLTKSGIKDNTLKGRDKDRDKLTEHNITKHNIINKEKENKKEKFDFIENEDWKNLFSEWIEYKKEQWKFTYKSEKSLKTAYDQLISLSNGDLAIAKQIVGNSIASGYRGLFELKNNTKLSPLKKGNLLERNKRATRLDREIAKQKGW